METSTIRNAHPHRRGPRRLRRANRLAGRVEPNEAANVLLIEDEPLDAALLRRSLRAQEQLFTVGSPGHELFLVLSGSIHILMPSQDGDVLVERFSRGEMLGEVAILDDQPRTATGIAAEPSEVLAIGRADFHAFLDAFPKYRERLITILVQRLRRTSSLVSQGFITPAERAALNEIYDFNPLVFDYVLKRTLRARDADGREHRFSPAIFEQHPQLAPTRR